MASRTITTPIVDYCLSPVHVVKDGRDLLVPCGKCKGCLLHRANSWSMRLANEIEASRGSIFFTLTYSNKYLPKLVSNTIDGLMPITVYELADTVRWNGVEDVPRIEPDFPAYFVSERMYSISIKNFTSPDGRHYIGYSSRRDCELYLKLLRQDLINHGFKQCPGPNRFFRYFIISEYGPTTFRPHLHGIIFPSTLEIASYLIEYGLFQNWKMCSEDQFYPYTHYCDSGARNYVTNYLTCSSELPKIYRENKVLRPFRKASKAPAIGYIGENPAKIYEDVSVGVTSYVKPITRLGVETVVKRSSDYLSRLFPKCYRFSELPFSRIYAIYGNLWKEINRHRSANVICPVRFLSDDKLDEVDDVKALFRAYLHPMDYTAALACYKYCESFESSVDHYLYLLDMCWYSLDMSLLKFQYETQEKIISSFSSCAKLAALAFYSNSWKFIESCQLTGKFQCLFLLLQGFSYELESVDCLLHDLRTYRPDISLYEAELDDILVDMVKMPKFNELSGISPTCFT